jgi:hypothetical protein
MKDKVTLTLDQFRTLARVCKLRKPLLFAELRANRLDITGDEIFVVLTLGRTNAKEMQKELVYAVQAEQLYRDAYIAINDAFRNAYDETLRRQCGEA